MKDNFANKFKEQIRLNFDASTQEYLQFELKHDFYGKLTEQLLDHIDKAGLVPSGWERQPLKILDVGCGIGNSTERLRQHFPSADLTGLDLSPRMLEAARENHPGINFICGDAENLLNYFPSAHFDLIIYPASLFILPKQEQSLQQARNLLKTGGVIAASIIQGIEEINHTQILSLSGVPGIIKNDALLPCLNELFSDVRSSLLQIPMPQSVLKDIYSIPALLAGLFPKFLPQERLLKLEALLEEVRERNLDLIQEWMLVAAVK